MSHPAPNPQDPNQQPNHNPYQQPGNQQWGTQQGQNQQQWGTQQGQDQQPPQPPKAPWYKRPGCLIPIGILVALIIIGMAINGANDSNSASPSNTHAPVQPGTTDDTIDPTTGAQQDGDVMQYILETDGAAVDATWMSTGGNISQEQGVPSGWTKEANFDGKWDAIMTSLSGQLDGSGTVTCKMLWNGQVVAENSSSGDYAVVTCSPDQSKMK